GTQLHQIPRPARAHPALRRRQAEPARPPAALRLHRPEDLRPLRRPAHNDDSAARRARAERARRRRAAV
ncbi:hypothetical protein LTR16_011458, partial [Cryomyces antarcticus]